MDPTTVWQHVTVMWYGQGSRCIEWCSGTGWWYRYRAYQPSLPLRWVISRDPSGGRDTRLYFATDPQLTGSAILLAFMNRWSAEVTFEEGRAHLGIETQRQWSDAAIERSTPCVFALLSVVTLMGKQLYPAGDIPVRQAAWYTTQQATFSNVLAVVRRSLGNPAHYASSQETPDAIVLARAEMARLFTAAYGSP